MINDEMKMINDEMKMRKDIEKGLLCLVTHVFVLVESFHQRLFDWILEIKVN